MKIALTGGGTGGHFYPLIAVVEGIENICKERKLLEPQYFYLGPEPFDKMALAEHDIEYHSAPAGKLSRERRIPNPFSFFTTAAGITRCFFLLFSIYPDVVFSTGGYAAFPTLFATRLLRIPVVIYDADARPGRVSLWASKFARWIAVAHPNAAATFPEKVREKIARTGHPIRVEIESPAREGGHEFLKLDPNAPTIFIVGGSQGAQALNEIVIDTLPTLVASYNVVHQAGIANAEEAQRVAGVVLHDSLHAERYRVFGLLNALALKMTAGITSLIISRAGSGSIFEIASWGIPAILVPIPGEVSHDQTENAFSYARAGAALVIEQKNLTPHILLAEIKRLMDDEPTRRRMSEAAKAFARPGAGRKIAEVILETAISHEPI
ncbi:MAG: UDP-N-acetylglucosamine--N-acetylmuramyl-(pentapeptide) pyrophosphoryl-undecaprenol N-acetylglucosamine transferase [Patescibacteria group bacterium]